MIFCSTAALPEVARPRQAVRGHRAAAAVHVLGRIDRSARPCLSSRRPRARAACSSVQRYSTPSSTAVQVGCVPTRALRSGRKTGRRPNASRSGDQRRSRCRLPRTRATSGSHEHDSWREPTAAGCARRSAAAALARARPRAGEPLGVCGRHAASVRWREIGVRSCREPAMRRARGLRPGSCRARAATLVVARARRAREAGSRRARPAGSSSSASSSPSSHASVGLGRLVSRRAGAVRAARRPPLDPAAPNRRETGRDARSRRATGRPSRPLRRGTGAATSQAWANVSAVRSCAASASRAATPGGIRSTRGRVPLVQLAEGRGVGSCCDQQLGVGGHRLGNGATPARRYRQRLSGRSRSATAATAAPAGPPKLGCSAVPCVAKTENCLRTFAEAQSGQSGSSPFRTSSSKCDSHSMQTYS